jgi:hypothetical protein
VKFGLMPLVAPREVAISRANRLANQRDPMITVAGLRIINALRALGINPYIDSTH